VTNHTEFTGKALYTGAFLIAMNKEKYESLPDDLKAVIDANSGAEFSAQAGKFAEAADAKARQIAVDLGNTITVLDAAQSAEWEAAAKPTYDTWLAESAAAGFDGQAILNDALTLLGN
jgi:C4-dicarboxylate-binding protein DctP